MATPRTRHTFLTDVERVYGRQLRRFLSSRMRGAPADVSDVVQEVFLRLLRIKDHEAIRNPQAYLHTVAIHVLQQYALQRSTRPESRDPALLDSDLQATTAPDPADELAIGELLEKVGRGLEQVSPRAYATLVMYRCEGMTLAEIGARLGVSHVMVRKYLARAIAYCDQCLEEMQENGEGHP